MVPFTCTYEGGKGISKRHAWVAMIKNMLAYKGEGSKNS